MWRLPWQLCFGQSFLVIREHPGASISYTMWFYNVWVHTHGKATLFKRYFHSVYTNCSFSLPNVCDLPQPDSVLGDVLISEDDVFDALTSLDPSKAMA